LAELARLCCFDVEVKRLRIVSHDGEEEIVRLGHRAADLMGQPVADLPFIKVPARHQL